MQLGEGAGDNHRIAGNYTGNGCVRREIVRKIQVRLVDQHRDITGYLAEKTAQQPPFDARAGRIVWITDVHQCRVRTDGARHTREVMSHLIIQRYFADGAADGARVSRQQIEGRSSRNHLAASQPKNECRDPQNLRGSCADHDLLGINLFARGDQLLEAGGLTKRVFPGHVDRRRQRFTRDRRRAICILVRDQANEASACRCTPLIGRRLRGHPQCRATQRRGGTGKQQPPTDICFHRIERPRVCEVESYNRRLCGDNNNYVPLAGRCI